MLSQTAADDSARTTSPTALFEVGSRLVAASALSAGTATATLKASTVKASATDNVATAAAAAATTTVSPPRHTSWEVRFSSGRGGRDGAASAEAATQPQTMPLTGPYFAPIDRPVVVNGGIQPATTAKRRSGSTSRPASVSPTRQHTPRRPASVSPVRQQNASRSPTHSSPRQPTLKQAVPVRARPTMPVVPVVCSPVPSPAPSMSAQNYTPVDVKVDLLEAKLRASTTRVQQLHAEKLAMEARVAAMEQVMAVQEAQLFVRAAGASGGDAEDRDKVHQLLMTWRHSVFEQMMRAAIAEEQHDMELRGRDQTAMELRAEVARLRGELELADARATAVRADLLCQKQAHESSAKLAEHFQATAERLGSALAQREQEIEVMVKCIREGVDAAMARSREFEKEVQERTAVLNERLEFALRRLEGVDTLLQQTASVTPVLERKLVAIEEQRNLLMKQLQTALSDRDTVIAGREEEKRRHESVVDELRAEYANVKCASDTELAAARDDIARLVDEHDKECKELIEKIVELQEAQDRIPPTLNLESTGVQTAKTITTQYQDIDTQTDIRATMGQQLSIADLLSSSRERLLKQPAPLLPLPSMHAPALFDPTTHYPVDVMTAADESHRKIQDLKRLSLALLKDE